MWNPSRREFLKSTMTTACSAGLGALNSAELFGDSGASAVVNPQTSYRDAWSRSQTPIRKLLPLAEELKIVIAIEDLWNKFLLRTLQMDAHIQEFQSPWTQDSIDVGNIQFYGQPQH